MIILSNFRYLCFVVVILCHVINVSFSEYIDNDDTPLYDPLSVRFTDVDTRDTHIAGKITIIRDMEHEQHTDSFSVYFASVNVNDYTSGLPATKLLHPLGYAHAVLLENIRLPSIENPR